MESLSIVANAVVIIGMGLISGYFATRVNILEKRVDEVESDLHKKRSRELQLRDFIYRNGLQPPDPEEWMI